MTGTAIVASYAALVATGAFVWNVFTWVQARRTQITIRFLERAYYRPDGQQAGWAFIVVVINGSAHDVSVAEVAVTDGDSDYWPLSMVAGNGDKLPVTIRQHHQVELGCDSTDLEASNWRKMTVRVRLGDDSLHYSPMKRSDHKWRLRRGKRDR